MCRLAKDGLLPRGREKRNCWREALLEDVEEMSGAKKPWMKAGSEQNKQRLIFSSSPSLRE